MKLIQKLTSEEIKKIELDILDKFTTYCDKNNLRYYLDWGTLLGAVRHKGFIPWDDDIDVSMPRSDFERLIQLTKKNPIDTNIKFKSPYDKTNPYPFAKCINTKTFADENNIRSKLNDGIWIDVFTIDGITNNEQVRNEFCKKQGKLQKLLFYSIERKYKGNTVIKNILGFFFIPILRFMHLRIKNKIIKASKKWNIESSDTIAYTIGWNIKKTIIKKEELKQTTVTFEGKEFKTFANYDDRLKKLYGDYMTLPPENQRLCHNIDAWEIE